MLNCYEGEYNGWGILSQSSLIYISQIAFANAIYIYLNTHKLLKFNMPNSLLVCIDLFDFNQILYLHYNSTHE